MRLCLCLALCLIAHAVFAVDFDVSQKGAFIVLRHKSGSTLVMTSAIRISHISSVTLDTVDGDYRISIVTAPPTDDSGSGSKRYELKADDRRAVEEAFGLILDLLAQDEAEKNTPARALRR
jgi:hypothetical protein